MPHGSAYARVFRAGRDNSMGTAWNLHSVKSNRVMDALSGIERSAMYEALLDPSVLDLREQYPAYDAERIQKYLNDTSLRIPRSMIPTMDLVLTRLDERSPSGLSFEVVSSKYVKELGRPAVQRRLERDVEFCQALNWTFTLHTERETSDVRRNSARTLCMMADGLDVDALREPAWSAAAKVRAMADGRTFAALKRSVGRSLSLSVAQVGHLVSVMALHGFISVNLDKQFDESSPFCLSEQT